MAIRPQILEVEVSFDIMHKSNQIVLRLSRNNYNYKKNNKINIVSKRISYNFNSKTRFHY
jgi:hypothetical protein